MQDKGKKKTIEEHLSTLVTYECDVLIAGGGVAGIAAALAAARQGAKVCLVEKQYMLGGLATAGLVTIYLPLCDGQGHQVSFGIAEELFHLSILYGWERDYPAAWIHGGSQEEKIRNRFRVRYNAQLFAMAAEQLLLKEGVKILYGTSVCSVAMEGEYISTVLIENKSGRSGIGVKSVVDATGDGDICAMAGEKTALFKQQNILAAWYYHCGKDGYQLNMNGFSDIPEDEKDGTQEIVYLKNRRFQGIEAEELSEMVQLSHKEILEDVMKKRKQDLDYMPVTMSTVPQVRMTRRIEGKYTMTIEDDRREFEDSIGMISNWKKRGPVYEVPFRCLYGGRVKNLITAGRSISAADSMWDVTRVIPACAVTGQAAGMAAAMTNDFTSLNVKSLQECLHSAGVRLFYGELMGI